MPKLKFTWIAPLSAAAVATGLLAGCGNRTIRLDIVPVEDQLQQKTIESYDAGAFTSDKIAEITVSGLTLAT